ncbi:MAG: hypothetical protein HY961_00945 [Ignavibacteriae bacterium]|nr:hypothetical protein [Ignavibacteriota bacterium]
MFTSFSRVGFCGSRSLPVSALPLVSSVVSSVLASSASLAVGCSVGADALVLSSVPLGVLRRVSIFAAFGRGGAGACPVSSVSGVLSAARAGASVRWCAGGGLRVPLRVRLAARSVALVRFLAASPSSALVCFLASPRSRGSLLACRVAARLGVRVFVFCVGFSPARLPRLGRGSWVPVSSAGQIAAQWVPAKKVPPTKRNQQALFNAMIRSCRTITILALLILFASSSFASVPRAIANAQQGLAEALKYEMPKERKFKHIERWENGILIYKFSIKRLGERTFTIRVTGYDISDEVGIITFKVSNPTPSDRQRK